MTSSKTYRIAGMTCASCVRRVETALAAVAGVTHVSVNLATDSARVTGVDVREAELAAALDQRGYALRPSVSNGPRPAVRRGGGRVLVAWLFTLPLLATMLPGLHLHFAWWLEAGMSAVVAFGAGAHFFVRAARQARRGESSMDTLIALGALASWSFGVVDGLAGRPHPPFEAAAALVAFLLTGKLLEARARHRASDAVEALLALSPSTATRLLAEGGEVEVAVATLRPGDCVRVRPGRAVPVDGEVVAGQAEVEEAQLTGEPLPVPKTRGARVLAGASVHGGFLDVRVEAVGHETWLANLGRRVEAAQGSRAPAQALADRISAVFVPLVLVAALGTLAFWWWHTGALAQAWRPAVTVLVIACPCALGLATPVAMAAALGASARAGVLVKDAGALEQLARVTDLAFDKTGTLTHGRPSVWRIDGDDPAEVLRLAAALERGSAHPIARGIVAAAPAGETLAVDDFRAHAYGGVSGRVGERTLKLGSGEFIGHPLPQVAQGLILVGLTEGERLLGTITLCDTVKPGVEGVLKRLRRLGLRLHLLSGDRQEAAAALAAGLGLDSAEGGCTPARKQARVAELRAAKGVVAFVGDGANDALALAAADAGIALPGLEAAEASAPINLLRAELAPLPAAVALARKTVRIVRQNLIWAFAYNLVLVPLAAANQLDRLGGPMLAGAAMGLSSLTVVLNALRLRAPRADGGPDPVSVRATSATPTATPPRPSRAANPLPHPS